MAALTLEHFTNAAYDYEHSQYRILAGLQKTREAFAQNHIYPHLGELVKLYESLQIILKRSADLDGALPKQLKGVDLAGKRVVYEWPALDRDEVADVRDVIEWALPHIQTAIEEGRTIFEFVDENLHVEEVGVVPSYVQEGYLLVPDHEAGALHVLQYSLSIFTGAEEKYRSLKTSHLKQLPYGSVHPSPRSIKLDLVAEHRALPNPATYFVDTELAFPFEPTIFPIAKRKLMRFLHTA